MQRVVRFPVAQTGETVLFRLPLWATEDDEFAAIDVEAGSLAEAGLPEGARVIVHLCGLYDFASPHAVQLSDGSISFRYIRRIYKPGLESSDGLKQTAHAKNKISVLGRVVEIWLTADGSLRYTLVDEWKKQHGNGEKVV
jgi:hypothetical protein